MATSESDLITSTRPDPAEPAERGWQPYRLSVRQYLKAIAAGVFEDDTQVELLGGLLLAPMIKGDAHHYLAMVLPPALRGVVPPPWLVVTEISLRLGPRSRPEPDLMILQGPASRYKVRPPAPGDVAVVVEISDTSYRFDRGSRWHRYAAARVPTYWIVNLITNQVEVSDATHRGIKWQKYAQVGIPIDWIVNLNRCRVELHSQPSGAILNPTFANFDDYGESETVPIVIHGHEIGRLDVAELLPRA